MLVSTFLSVKALIPSFIPLLAQMLSQRFVSSLCSSLVPYLANRTPMIKHRKPTSLQNTLNFKTLNFVNPSVIRPLHTSSILQKKQEHAQIKKDVEADVLLDGDLVPQSRLNEIFSFMGEDPLSQPLETIEVELQPFLVNEVLAMGRHVKVLPGGRISSFSALVMVGTGSGTAGLGRAKAETVSDAVVIATKLAQKNLISIVRHRGCTVSKTNLYKYKRTKVLIKACRTGYGIRASPEMRVVLKAFGLTDMCVVTIGRKTNRHAMYRALFKAFQHDIRTPEEITKALGKKRFDVAAFYYSPKL